MYHKSGVLGPTRQGSLKVNLRKPNRGKTGPYILYPQRNNKVLTIFWRINLRIHVFLDMIRGRITNITAKHEQDKDEVVPGHKKFHTWSARDEKYGSSVHLFGKPCLTMSLYLLSAYWHNMQELKNMFPYVFSIHSLVFSP